MLSWAALFLVIGIIAGILGLTGIAGISVQIAWILFVVGLMLAIVFFYRWPSTASMNGIAN